MRRALGGLIIGAALIAGMTPAALGPIVVTGRSTAIAVAELPVLGSCVGQQSVPTLVDCGSLHSAEITAAWTTVPADPPGSAYQRCELAGERYLAGIDAQPGPTWGWTRPNVVVEVARGPDGQVRPGWSWTACLLAPATPGVAQDGGYLGRISDQRTGRPPVAVRTCFDVADSGRDDAGQSTVALTDLPCDSSHRAELLGLLTFERTGGDLGVAGTLGPGVAYTTDTDPTRRAQCLALAQERTGVVDPTYGRRLEVVVRTRVVGETFGTAGSVTASPMVVVEREYLGVCDLEASGGRRLTRSVLDLGAAPLPLA